MAKARARTQSRKVKDKWKAKQWYTVMAPPMFNKAPLAETLADDPQKLMGRVVTTTLQDLTGDFKQMHIKLNFQVNEVTGSSVDTRYVGHTLTSDYVRRMVRRNHSKISGVFDVKTKDGAFLRVKPFAVSERRSQGSQQSLVRKIMGDTISGMAEERTLAGFVRDVIDGTVAANIYKASRKVYPLRRVEVNKTEVRAAPTITIEEDVMAIPEPASETPPEEEGTPPEAEEESAAGEESERPTKEAESTEEAAAEEEKPAEATSAEAADEDAADDNKAAEGKEAEEAGDEETAEDEEAEEAKAEASSS